MKGYIKKILANKVVKNFSFLTASNFFNQFTLVFASIKIARTLGPVDFGSYSYLFVQAMLYAVIAEFGLRAIVIRSIARNPNNTKSIFLSSLFLQLIGLIFSTALMITYEHYNPSINPSLIIFLIINIFLINLWSTCESIWQGWQKMSIPAIINVSYSIVWVLFILIIPNQKFNIRFLYTSYVLIQILQTSTLFIILIFHGKVLKGESSFFRNMILILKESIFYYFNSLIALPTNALSNNFLEINSSKSQIGYFNTSNRILSPIKTVTTLGFTAIFPNLSILWVKDKESFNKKLQSGFPLLIILFGSICFSFVMICRDIIYILFGSEFLPSFEIMKYQIWFLFIFSCHSLIGTIWATTDNYKILSFWSVVNTLIATPILFIGSKYGGSGLAHGYLLSYIITFPFIFYYFQKSLNIRINITKEILIIVALFSISVFFPNDTNIFLRILAVLVTLAIIAFFYQKTFMLKIAVVK